MITSCGFHFAPVNLALISWLCRVCSRYQSVVRDSMADHVILVRDPLVMLATEMERYVYLVAQSVEIVASIPILVRECFSFLALAPH